MRQAVLAAAVLSLVGCATTLPVGKSMDIDPETGASCTRACMAVGMKVAAIVFIKDMGGCVCEPGTAAATGAAVGAPSAAGGSGGASAAQMGGAVLVMLEEEEARSKQQSSSSSSVGAGAGASGMGHR
jgi:hypothetical protein